MVLSLFSAIACPYPDECGRLVKRLHRGRRSSGRQAEHGRSGTQRCVVWWSDEKSLAAPGRFVRLQCRAWSRHRRRAGGVFHRQRNRRQHRGSHDALRHYRPATDLWPGSAKWRHDAVLVARQTGPHDPQCRGFHAGALSRQSPGQTPATLPACPASWTTMPGRRSAVCASATFPNG